MFTSTLTLNIEVELQHVVHTRLQRAYEYSYMITHDNR